MRRLLLPLVALLLAGTATFAVRAWLERRDSPRGGRRPGAGAAQGGAGGGGRPGRRLLRAAGFDALARLARRCRARDLSGPRAGRRGTVRWRRRQAPAHRRSATVRGQRGQTRRARLSRRGAGAWHAGDLGAGRRSRRQRRPDLPGRPGRPHSDPDAERRGRSGGRATGERDRARGSAGHRHGTPADQRRYAKRILPASRRARPRSRPRPKPPRRSRSWPSWAGSP